MIARALVLERVTKTFEDGRQVVPVLKEAATQLEALKKDASLSSLKKVERLKEIGGSAVDKITPILNAQQQQKFQALRDRERRRMIEKMGSQVLEKLEAELRAKL